MRLAGAGGLTAFLLIFAALCFGFRSPWLSLLFCSIAVTASFSPVTVSLLRETNTPNVMGVAVSFMNFCSYLAVALLGNAVGLLMDLFLPERSGSLQIYTANSYLAVFGVLLLLSGVAACNAFRLRETMGENYASNTP